MLRTKLLFWLSNQISKASSILEGEVDKQLGYLQSLVKEKSLVEDSIRLNLRELDLRNIYLAELGYKLNSVNNEIEMKELEVVEDKQG